MVTPSEEPDEDKLRDVQQKIDHARARARDHGMAPENDQRPEEVEDAEEATIDGLTRPGLG